VSLLLIANACSALCSLLTDATSSNRHTVFAQSTCQPRSDVCRHSTDLCSHNPFEPSIHFNLRPPIHATRNFRKPINQHLSRSRKSARESILHRDSETINRFYLFPNRQALRTSANNILWPTRHQSNRYRDIQPTTSIVQHPRAQVGVWPAMGIPA